MGNNKGKGDKPGAEKTDVERAADWAKGDKGTDDLVKDSFKSGDADKDWEDRPGK